MPTQAAPPETKTDLKQKNFTLSKSKATIWLAVTLLIGISSIGYSIWSNRNPHYLTLVTKPISKYRKSMVIQYPSDWEFVERNRFSPNATFYPLNWYVKFTPRPKPFLLDWVDAKLFPQTSAEWKKVEISISLTCDEEKIWSKKSNFNIDLLKIILDADKSLYPETENEIKPIFYTDAKGFELETVSPKIAGRTPRPSENTLIVAADFNSYGSRIFLLANAPEKLGKENNRIAHEIFKRLRVISTDR